MGNKSSKAKVIEKTKSKSIDENFPVGDLPDVSHDVLPQIQTTLDLVGMESIEMPVWARNDRAESFRVPAKIDAFVNLADPTAKGIHMSRLFLRLQEYLDKKEVVPALLNEILLRFREDQEGLSTEAFVRIQFELPLKRKALISGLEGWRQYPIVAEATLKGGEVQIGIGATVHYSSTCPCSAALARQLVQQKFISDFSGLENITKQQVTEWLVQESSMAGLPHAQRSFAEFKVKLKPATICFGIQEMINEVEQVLATPVQAAVKRVDEQEFARLNATNLMFCEDAARRLKLKFEANPVLADYSIRVVHRESLHPHDAVARVVKGVASGFAAELA